MIQEVDAALEALVRRDVLNGSRVEVVFDAPTKEWVARRNAPTINLYLYDIREDLSRRQVSRVPFHDAATSYVAEHRLTFPVLTFPDNKTARLYRADEVSVTVVLDPDGRVILGRPGGLTDAAVDSILAAVSDRPSGNVTVRH